MNKKAVLILVDGMRPDGMLQCENPIVEQLLEKSTYTLNARTVIPPVTLPAHMSMFHSVTPQRHGIVTNTFMPQVRPVKGICEQLTAAGKKCAFFYTWEELRDITRPESLYYSAMINQYRYVDSDNMITDAFISYYKSELPDFSFLYLGQTDEAGGHDHGWMSKEYMSCIRKAMDCVQRVLSAVDEDTVTIILADHGGHDRSHGIDIPEDMTIPVILTGSNIPKNKIIDDNVSILDIAPTIASITGTLPSPEWEGRSLI